MNRLCTPDEAREALALLDFLFGLPVVNGRDAEALRAAGIERYGDHYIVRARDRRPRVPGRNKLYKVEREFRELLETAWREGGQEAVDEVFARLRAGSGEVTSRELDALLKIVEQRAGPDLVDATAKGTSGAVEKAYKIGRTTYTTEPKYNLVDERAQEVLAEHTNYWIGEHYGEDVGPRIAETVKTEIIEAGLGRADAGAKLKELLEPEFGPKSDDYWEGTAAAAASRSRNLGAVASMDELGFTRITIVNPRDETTSPICEYITNPANGIVFEVARAVEQRDKILAARTPEAAKRASPWLRPEEVVGKSAKQLQAMGVTIPPFHFHCRSFAVVE